MAENHQAEAQEVGQFDLEKKLQDCLAELAKTNEILEEETSKRKQTENALQEIKENYSLLLNYANEAAGIIQKMREEIQNNLLSGSRKGIVVKAFLHDLKGPLALISSCAQFWIGSSNMEASLAENLKIIYESSQRATNLILKFMDLLASNALTIKPTNINEIIPRMWRLVRMDTRAFQVSFDAQLEPDLPQVIGNLEGLERVFYNLFLNAVQVLSQKGKISVQTLLRPKEKMVEITVADDGPGIPPEHRHKIFEPFFTTKAAGSGLGLAICHSIVQQHLGTITVDFPESGGTHFLIKLPASI
jgi:signal transduction histidine kinase